MSVLKTSVWHGSVMVRVLDLHSWARYVTHGHSTMGKSFITCLCCQSGQKNDDARGTFGLFGETKEGW